MSRLPPFCVLSLLFFVLSLFVLLPTARAVYDDAFVRTKFFPLSLATYADATNTTAMCLQKMFPDSELVSRYEVPCDFTWNRTHTCSGYLALLPSERAVVMAFRGSMGPVQVLREIATTLTAAPVPFFGDSRVNPFFLRAFLKLSVAGLLEDLVHTLDTHPHWHLWVTGHSLGGALAALAAGTTAAVQLTEPGQMRLVTFGEPRVGDRAFVEAMAGWLREPYRVVHAADLAAHLPPQGLLDYLHHGTEVWYPDRMGLADEFIVCPDGESPACSDSLSTYKWTDHLTYFETPIRVAETGCLDW